LHKLNAIYEENGCIAKINSKNPYFLLNLEEYCSVHNITLSRCDFLYVYYENDTFIAYFVELKEVESNLDNKKIDKLLNRIWNKFHQSDELANKIFEFFRITNPKKCFVWILPEGMYDDILTKICERSSSLFKHRKLLKNHDVKIGKCGEDIIRAISIKDLI
jgi:hypothetical protein